jgi:hypothetical protein
MDDQGERYGNIRNNGKFMKRFTKAVRRVALKYCGGCNPGFDRVACFESIRAEAGDVVLWTTLEDGASDAVLMISGCETACPEKGPFGLNPGRIIAVRSDNIDLKVIVYQLSGEEER